MNLKSYLSLIVVAGVVCASSAATLTVRTGSSRGPEITAIADATVREFARSLNRLTIRDRETRRRMLGENPFQSLPVSVIVRRPNGDVPEPPKSRAPGLTLQFDQSAQGAFPADYQQLLEAVWATAKPRIDAVFGDPSVGGTVVVTNYDATIGDRDALAGGYYFYNPGDGTQQIRFPVYSDSVGTKAEVTAINFIHTILLAYIGPKKFGSDGYQEGLVRAATMLIARTPGSLPVGLDAGAVEDVLTSSYDAGELYDWHNQRALGGPTFIAPNLRDVPLPIGGSTGGLYLLRYRMAGSAFQKVLAEYPNFAAELLRRHYADESGSVINQGQASLDALGGTGSTIEGRTFQNWAEQQWILTPNISAGQKLLVEAFPISSGLLGTDFGVFGIQAHSFKTNPNGDEVLLNGRTYPIYWNPSFTRIFASGQDDFADIQQGYGSVAPNFTDVFGGNPYRVTVDVPVGDENARVYLPAGAIATAANPTPNNLYGCVTGLDQSGGVTYQVRATWVGGSATASIANGAFGTNISTGNWGRSQSKILVQVERNASGNISVVNSRWVNKGPGGLALNLHVNSESEIVIPVTAGIQMIGHEGEIFSNSIPSLFGTAESQTLAARWNPTTAAYDLFPNFNLASKGQGLFVRMNSSQTVRVNGRAEQGVAQTVSLKPGWNIVCNPLTDGINLSQIGVVIGAGFERSFADAVTSGLIGTDGFAFVPGSNDLGSGVPETGSLGAITSLSPGQAVYIRVLAADGASLVFRPSGLRGRAPSDNGDPGYAFRGQIVIDDGRGASATAEVALHSRGTYRNDVGLDSGLPPSFGGLQIALRSGPRGYRDVRPTKGSQRFWGTLENLIPGQTYRLIWRPSHNRPATLWNVTSRKRTQGLSDLSLTFKARSSRETIQVILPAVKS